jgi:KDO2-lipid IV(A) lauroyltransferase
VSQIAIQEFRQADPPPPSRTIAARLRHACAEFWLNYFFFFAERAPRYCAWTKRGHLWLARRVSRVLNDNTRANARRIFGAGVPDDRLKAFTRDVCSNFFDFVYDVGRTRRMSRDQLMSLVDSIDGHDRYQQVRALGTGTIIVTAHMGSFETGLAALMQHETQPIHVVFKRDDRCRFEQIRKDLRARLGVREAAVDDGWTIWMRLRDALVANHVVNLQGDRVMPGQKGQAVKFLHGHLLLPTGPIKLAIASGSPLVPIFSIRTPAGRIKIHIEEPIWVDPAADHVDGAHPALLQLASIIERYVKTYPEQWLLLHPAFVEDSDVREVRA